MSDAIGLWGSIPFPETASVTNAMGQTLADAARAVDDAREDAAGGLWDTDLYDNTAVSRGRFLALSAAAMRMDGTGPEALGDTDIWADAIYDLLAAARETGLPMDQVMESVQQWIDNPMPPDDPRCRLRRRDR